MKKRILFPVAFVIVAGTFLGGAYFTACQKKKALATLAQGTSVDLESFAGNDLYDIDEPTQLWHTGDSCVCIVFGYGYNDDNFVASTLESLQKRFGNSKDGGAIYPLVFPKDFTHGSKTYITNLVDLVDSKNIRGLIILGAPENTNEAISRLATSWGGTLPYPVFSFFSQDDVLPMEGVCDFVLDADMNTDNMSEENTGYVKDAPIILESAVECALESPAGYVRDNSLSKLVEQIVSNSGSSHKVDHYIDSETSLRSVNHFILK